MGTIASQITNLMIVYSSVYSDADQRKYQSSASLSFVWGIYRDRWIPCTKASYAENVSIWLRHHVLHVTKWYSNWMFDVRQKFISCLLILSSTHSAWTLVIFPANLWCIRLIIMTLIRLKCSLTLLFVKQSDAESISRSWHCHVPSE